MSSLIIFNPKEMQQILKLSILLFLVSSIMIYFMTPAIDMNSSEKSHEHRYISLIQSVKMSTKNAIQVLEL
jgi:hypothetical protein